MEVNRDRIKELLDEVRAIVDGPRNQAKAKYWQPIATRAEFQPPMIRLLPNSQAGKIPFVIEPAVTLWSQILGYDLRAYYTDPLVYLTAILEQKIYHARHFDDDTFIDKRIRLLFAMLLEGSVLGIPYGFSEEGYPWLEHYSDWPVQSPQDLAKLKLPNFYHSGIMPQAHRFYEEINSLVGDDFLVMFPAWLKGPFGVAVSLQGFENTLINLALDPPFSRDLLSFVVEAREHWERQRAQFFGHEIRKGAMGNDDVASPTLSPKMYDEMILPYESRLDDFYGGLFYWHSCGNVTPYLKDIHEHHPRLDLFHCGPWTDPAAAVATFKDTDTAIQFCLNPVEDVQQATEDRMRARLQQIRSACGAFTNCYLNADSLEALKMPEEEVAHFKNWIRMAREVLS